MDAERELREFVAAALFRSAYLLTGQREAAEDLLQTRAWLGRFTGSPPAGAIVL
jgi:hypothetical protein